MVFDLDGTLVDSLQDLADGVNASLAQVNKTPVSMEYVKNSIGNGARKLIERCMPDSSEEEVDQAFDFFMPYYVDNCTKATKGYEGVYELLDFLEMKEVPMAVLTNKPIEATLKILNELDYARYFKHIFGGDSFAEKKPSPVGLLEIMKLEEKAPEELLMIGDGTPDILSAQAAKIDTIAILDGIGKSSDLTDLNPTYTVENFNQIQFLPVIQEMIA